MFRSNSGARLALERNQPMREPKMLKKSETLEIRLPHATKQAFMTLCRAEGRSASEAVRGSIEAALAERKSATRGPATRWLAAGVLAATVGAMAAPSLARPSLPAEFARLDADHDGAVSRLEFARAARVQVVVTVGGAGGVTELLSAQDRAALVDQAFDRIDADRNGRINFAEFRRAYGR